MQIGDLVRYATTYDVSRDPVFAIGVIANVITIIDLHIAYEVLWADGRTTTHSNRWLIPIQETK